MKIYEPQEPVIGINITIEEGAFYKKAMNDMSDVLKILQQYNKGIIVNTTYGNILTEKEIENAVATLAFMYTTFKLNAMWTLTE